MKIRTVHSAAGTVRIAALAVLVAVSASGCAMSSPREAERGGENPSASPAFAGAFASEYLEAWKESRSEAVRQILIDESITDQEWSQVREDLERCLQRQGIDLTTYNADGSYAVEVGRMDGGAANEAMGRCEEDSGEAWLGYLYRAQTSNPSNIPATELLTECLVRNHAVPDSYTEKQYLADAPDRAFPFTAANGWEVLESCTADFDFVG